MHPCVLVLSGRNHPALSWYKCLFFLQYLKIPVHLIEHDSDFSSLQKHELNFREWHISRCEKPPDPVSGKKESTVSRIDIPDDQDKLCHILHYQANRLSRALR